MTLHKSKRLHKMLCTSPSRVTGSSSLGPKSSHSVSQFFPSDPQKLTFSTPATSASTLPSHAPSYDRVSHDLTDRYANTVSSAMQSGHTVLSHLPALSCPRRSVPPWSRVERKIAPATTSLEGVWATPAHPSRSACFGLGCAATMAAAAAAGPWSSPSPPYPRIPAWTAREARRGSVS